jgi:diguanylate cyclase (GGDEF)-like protein/PAS domain S-box-containing protein
MSTKSKKTTIIEHNSLKKSLSLLKATLESTADGILVVDRNGHFSSYNKKFAQIWNIPEIVLKNKQDHKAITYVLEQLKDPDSFIVKLQQLYAEPSLNCFDEIEFKDGRIFERYSIPQKMGRAIIGRVFSFRDVTARKRMEYQLLHQATHDSLTNLPNRAVLLDRISISIKYAQRQKKNVAIVFLDLDRFKGINDSLGHEAGDILLKRVAERLQSSIRESDTLARWGGDEFVMVIPDLKTEEDVLPVIRQCMMAMEEPLQIQTHNITVRFSVGISFFPRDSKIPNNLLKCADAAMYQAKSEGRNNFQFYKAHMTEQAIEKLELENDLRYAVEKNQFTLYYQPIINVRTEEIIGVEALIRWQHPVKGLIPPDHFIPLAEETGLIIPIGDWVIQEACTQSKTWQEMGLSSLFVAVNVSTHQFKEKDFISKVENILDNTQVKAETLELEITESSLMNDLTYFRDILSKLKEKKISISIDDFGTGYSSLSYLKILPVDKLKIDKSFVQQDELHRKDSIIASIISMAKKLKLKVVAEGVETKAQYLYLKNNNCEQVQGYYFSRPTEAHTLTQTLLKEKKRIALTSA